MAIGPTITEIKEYLISADLKSKITCGNGTLCEILKTLITPEGIDSQINLESVIEVKTCWWIEYSEVNDTFVFKSATFDKEYNPVTHQAYEYFLKDKVIFTDIDGTTLTKESALYTEDKKVIWKRKENTNVYEIDNNIQKSSHSKYFIKNIPIIIKTN